MATKPTPGGSDGTYGTELNAFLDIEHNADGTHAIKQSVDGTPTRVFTKYLTGTTDADSLTLVAHSITGIDKILSVTVAVYDGSIYAVGDYKLDNNVATTQFQYYWTASNVGIDSVGTDFQSQKYRIKIDYIV